MDKEKDLIRIYITEEDKLAVSCNTDSEEEYDMAIDGLYTLLENTPSLAEGLMDVFNSKVKAKSFFLSLINNSKIPS